MINVNLKTTEIKNVIRENIIDVNLVAQAISVNLTGGRGARGIDGIQGVDGAPGADGEDGLNQIGVAISGANNRSVLFIDSSGQLAQSSTFVYTTAGSVGIGTASPNSRYRVQIDPTGLAGVGFAVMGASTDYTNGVEFGESATQAGGVYWMTAPRRVQFTSYGHGFPLEFGNNWAYMTTTGLIGMGTNNPSAKLQVHTPNHLTVGQIVRGSTSQAANLAEWQTSAGTAVTTIGADGIPTLRKDITSGNQYYNAMYIANQGVFKVWPTQKLVTYGGISADNRVDIYGGSQYGDGAQFTVYGASYSTDSSRAGSAEFMVKSGQKFSLWEYDGILESIMFAKKDGISIGKGSFFAQPTPNAQLDVTTRAANRIALIAKAAVSQTANIQEWRDSNDVSCIWIPANGRGFTLQSNTTVASKVRMQAYYGDAVDNLTYWSHNVDRSSGSWVQDVSSRDSVGLMIGGYSAMQPTLNMFSNPAGTSLPFYGFSYSGKDGGVRIGNFTDGECGGTSVANLWVRASAGFSNAMIVQGTQSALLSVGQNGATNPAFVVNTNTASSVTGVQVTSNAAGGRAAMDAISSSGNAALRVSSKGSADMEVRSPSGDVVLQPGGSTQYVFGASVATFAKALTLPTLTDAAAPNNSIYYSSTAGKLVFKDTGGTVNNLY